MQAAHPHQIPHPQPPVPIWDNQMRSVAFLETRPATITWELFHRQYKSRIVEVFYHWYKGAETGRAKLWEYHFN